MLAQNKIAQEKSVIKCKLFAFVILYVVAFVVRLWLTVFGFFFSMPCIMYLNNLLGKLKQSTHSLLLLLRWPIVVISVNAERVRSFYRRSMQPVQENNAVLALSSAALWDCPFQLAHYLLAVVLSSKIMSLHLSALRPVPTMAWKRKI